MPKSLVKEEAGATDTYAKFIAEPFEAGYGMTIGNSLRRVLLSSLEGASITAVRIEGADHEFATLPGVVEDVIDIVLNLKNVKFKASDHVHHVLGPEPPDRFEVLLEALHALLLGRAEGEKLDLPVPERDAEDRAERSEPIGAEVAQREEPGQRRTHEPFSSCPSVSPC